MTTETETNTELSIEQQTESNTIIEKRKNLMNKFLAPYNGEGEPILMILISENKFHTEFSDDYEVEDTDWIEIGRMLIEKGMNCMEIPSKMDDLYDNGDGDE